MLRHETLFTGTAVFGGDAHFAQCFKSVQFQQSRSIASSQKETGTHVQSLLQTLSEVKHGSNTYSTANQQYVFRGLGHGETVAQGQQHVHNVAGTQVGEVFRALTLDLNQQPQFAVFLINEIDRNGST